ncbi:MAG TPA: hypothetical protein VM240_10795, partial [Verrucomicrobiae bacterium]|nr:hypothetical protein [Verrucomicrobiae bacterium]
ADEIDYVHLGPAHFGAFISSAYADGRRALWSNGVNGIYKVDHDTFRVLAHLPPAGGVPPDDEARADDTIAGFDAGNDGFLALIRAFRAAQVLRDLAGVYTMVDRDHRFYVGEKGGAIAVFGDRGPPAADAPIELKARIPLPAGVTGPLMGINMTFDGWIVTATEHGYVIVMARDGSRSEFVRLRHADTARHDDSRTGYGWVRNSFAVDEHGGIYVASREHLHKVLWDGKRLSLGWSTPYSNTTGEGTGSTPALMGFGSEDRLVVITDGDVRMNVAAFWRDSGALASSVPVRMGKLDLQAIQSEQAVVVAGYGALVVNNQPRNPPWYLPQRANRLLVSYLGSSPRYQPFGVQKFEWDPRAKTLREAWVNESVSSPNCVPMVSTGSGLAYLVGARDNQWTLEALDWDTGASTFHYLIGGQRYNSLFAGTLIDQAGRVFYGTSYGRVRLDPRPTLTPTGEATAAPQKP